MIDWNRAAELREEVGAEDFSEVVDLFLEECDDAIQQLALAQSARDIESQLHFLKGSALNIGFSDFASLCQTGEAAAAMGQTDDIDLDEISRAYWVARKIFLTQADQMLAA